MQKVKLLKELFQLIVKYQEIAEEKTMYQIMYQMKKQL
jgi:hypothetical protein